MTFHKNALTNDNFVLRSMEELVPEDHFVRKLDKSINWDFIYEKTKDLYSNTGRNCIDPVVLFKMLFINYLFNYNSMRRTCREIEVNVAYRWFLGLDFETKVPDYSTFSQNYIRRYHDSNLFDEIFETILSSAIEKHYVKLETIFGDSTFQKANANKRKYHNKTVELVKKHYEDELLKEINEERTSKGKKPFETLKGEEIEFDENGEEILIRKTKNIKESDTDKECGAFHKGEHEQMFAYSHQTFCDENGFVLQSNTVPANVHDSASFISSYEPLINKFGGSIKNVCLDAGYNTSSICREIIKNNQTPILPYHRPMGRNENLSKRQYKYDNENDYYVCPLGCVLLPTTINNEGYRIYKAQGCQGCPLKDKCTKMANKQLTRHIWEDYRDQADKLRSTELWKEIYPKRKQTIERVFADNKENHCLRFTRLKGLKKNQHQVLIIFAMHNLKKMALWDDKYNS